MVKYDEISAQLHIHFESDDMDLLQVGILNSSLHEILNQVAITVLNQENEHRESEGREKLFDFIPQTLSREDVLIRARIIGVSSGSLELNIQPIVAQIFSEPSAVAILNNLVANVIWAIATYSRRVVGSKIIRTGKPGRISEVLPATSSRRRLRPKVENLIKHLKDASNGGRIVLRSGDEELIVEFYSSEAPRRLNPSNDREEPPFYDE
jgi:hypothetical protein